MPNTKKERRGAQVLSSARNRSKDVSGELSRPSFAVPTDPVGTYRCSTLAV